MSQYPRLALGGADVASHGRLVAARGAADLDLDHLAFDQPGHVRLEGQEQVRPARQGDKGRVEGPLDLLDPGDASHALGVQRIIAIPLGDQALGTTVQGDDPDRLADARIEVGAPLAHFR
jgi:hypothetical protein